MFPLLFLFLCQGDEILAVNNMEVKGKSAFEVSSLLQGPNGTSVTIQVLDSNSKLVWHLLQPLFTVLFSLIFLFNFNISIITVRSSMATVDPLNQQKSSGNLLLVPQSFIGWNNWTMVLLLLGIYASKSSMHWPEKTWSLVSFSQLHMCFF